MLIFLIDYTMLGSGSERRVEATLSASFLELFLDQTQVEKRGEWTKEYLLEEHKERSPEQLIDTHTAD